MLRKFFIEPAQRVLGYGLLAATLMVAMISAAAAQGAGGTVDWLATIYSYLASAPDWLNAIALIVTSAAALAALTPTKVDDNALGWATTIINGALRIINVLAVNVGKAKNADDV